MSSSILASEKFKKEFGTIVEDIKLNGYWQKSFTGIFLLRRLFYALLLNILYFYPILQLCLVIALLSLPVRVY